MTGNVNDIIKNIESSMRMENIPLTDEDTSRLREYITENKDFYEVLQEIIIKHTYNTEYVSVRQDSNTECDD